MDIGCGQGELVRLMLADGYDAFGIDLEPGASGVGPGGRQSPYMMAITGRSYKSAQMRSLQLPLRTCWNT